MFSYVKIAICCITLSVKIEILELLLLVEENFSSFWDRFRESLKSTLFFG